MSIAQPPSGGWTCASWKPGSRVRPSRSTTRVEPSARERSSASSPTATIRPSRTARAEATGRAGSIVRSEPLTKSRSAGPAAGAVIASFPPRRVPSPMIRAGGRPDAARRCGAPPRRVRSRAPPDGRSSRSVPTRTRTSRSTGAPTAASMRRIWRFQPWASTTRYQVRPRPGGGSTWAGEERRLGAGGGPQRDQAGDPLLQRDPGRERRPLAAVERAGDGHGVLALHAVARMEHPLGPRPVVGEQEQPLRVLVEPADGIEPRPARHEPRRDEVEHRPGGVAVGRGRGDAGRLVDREVDAGRRPRRRSAGRRPRPPGAPDPPSRRGPPAARRR